MNNKLPVPESKPVRVGQCAWACIALWAAVIAVAVAATGCASIEKLLAKHLPPDIKEPAKPANGDQIDLSKVRWLHADVSGWPVTSKLEVSLSGGTVRLSHDKASVWPVSGDVAANPWVFVKIDGQWTAATFEWMRKGQTTKPHKTVAGDHIKRAPLSGNWKPTSGEEYGWMVSSLARDNRRTVNERTNVVLARWP